MMTDICHLDVMTLFFTNQDAKTTFGLTNQRNTPISYNFGQSKLYFWTGRTDIVKSIGLANLIITVR